MKLKCHPDFQERLCVNLSLRVSLRVIVRKCNRFFVHLGIDYLFAGMLENREFQRFLANNPRPPPVHSAFFCLKCFSLKELPFASFSDRVLKEVKFAGGTVGTSSYHSSSFKPEYAFQRTSNQYWHSGRDANAAGEAVIPFPHLIWYEFKSAILPGRVSFRPRHDGGCGNEGFWCGATKWQFIGTNDEICDENSAWTVLCEDLSGKPFERSRQSKYCDVESRVRGSFKCLGISVLDTSYAGGYSCVSMGGIRMWQRIEESVCRY